MLMVKEFFQVDTSTLSYVLYDISSRSALVIDPALDYEPAASQRSRQHVEEILRFLEDHQLQVHGILETHVHADHLSAGQVFKEAFPQAPLVISSGIRSVQQAFAEIYDLGDSLATDGSQFDHLMEDQEVADLGGFSVRCFHTPGHTPSCACYLVEDILFAGDVIFMPDFGTGRCDFPGGDAKELYHSIHEVLYRLPEKTRIYVGHDYQPGGRELRFQTTVAESKAENKHLTQNTTLDEFAQFRQGRDRELRAPRLLLPSIQFNMNAGRPLLQNSEGRQFLKIPIF